MSWRDRCGNRRSDDEDYESVEADLRKRVRGPEFVYCSECNLPLLKALGLKQHKVCPETTSNQDGR